ncbi:MAG: deoxyribodipyrimidine photo-lyase [Paraglaciecola sp.]|jgi:deoxyribodipyrimidine photo-lyase
MPVFFICIFRAPNQLTLFISTCDLIVAFTHSHIMKTKITTGLFWFRHDLRLTDNPALTQLCARVDRLLCVYVLSDEELAYKAACGDNIGEYKKQFLLQSIDALDRKLRLKTQYLLIADGPRVKTISELAERYDITHIGSSFHPGVYERKELLTLKSALPQIEWISALSHSLFCEAELPFALEALPATFTPFRKLVEALPITAPLYEPIQMPPPVEPPPAILQWNLISTAVQGGEVAGLAQLNSYLFDTDRVKEYKQTRNALDDWGSSSKLSFWLATGCLSVKTVYSQLKHYEQQKGANDSTYWLFFELLWREYYQWYLAKHQAKLFDFAGVQQRLPDTSFNQARFTRWCEGMTDYPIVNACMRQLNQTGYMSNRGRQIVASCLVHELDLDWRYGAAYFEQQLIDYDVASNWGNWQYLAGVGADPRGHRRFDLQKQSDIHDPKGIFRQRWLNSAQS